MSLILQKPLYIKKFVISTTFLSRERCTSGLTINQFIYSGSKVVYPSSQVLLAEADKILRKVMLYPNPENITSLDCFVVLDYYRTTLPCHEPDIIVPGYPEINDMVQICGSNDEIWFGHVLSVSRTDKTCHVNFFIEDPTFPGRYKQESFDRFSANTVEWESIVRICNGYWFCSGRYWHCTQ